MHFSKQGGRFCTTCLHDLNSEATDEASMKAVGFTNVVTYMGARTMLPVQVQRGRNERSS